jgi:hypothetical protein
VVAPGLGTGRRRVPAWRVRGQRRSGRAARPHRDGDLDRDLAGDPGCDHNHPATDDHGAGHDHDSAAEAGYDHDPPTATANHSAAGAEL